MVCVDFYTCIAFIMRVYLLLVIGMFFKNSKKITEYDLIVVGNNLAAVVSAGMAAKSGKTVALVSESELLLSEYSEGLLGFIEKDSNLYSLVETMGAKPILVGEEYQIPAGMASKIALKYLKENNVNTYLKAAPIGLLTCDEKVCGIAVATKFGAYTIKAGFVADFGERTFYSGKTISDNYLYAFQMEGVDLRQSQPPYDINIDLNLAEDITLHRDCRSEDSCVLSFKTSEKHTHTAVEIATKIVKHLVTTNPDFAGGQLLKFSLAPIPLGVCYNTPKKNLLDFKAGSILDGDDYLNALTCHRWFQGWLVP